MKVLKSEFFSIFFTWVVKLIKGNIFYIGSAPAFEEKVQKYFTETNAFTELLSNPFNETLEEVIALVSRLCLEKVISK